MWGGICRIGLTMKEVVFEKKEVRKGYTQLRCSSVDSGDVSPAYSQNVDLFGQ